jgi:hypothetical protein
MGYLLEARTVASENNRGDVTIHDMYSHSSVVPTAHVHAVTSHNIITGVAGSVLCVSALRLYDD